MVTKPRMKPKFTIALKGNGEQVFQHLVPLLNAEDSPVKGQVLKEHAYIQFPKENRSLLSPYLNLTLQKRDRGGFELIGRFRPVGITQDLAEFCLAHADETGGVRGAELLFAMEQEQTLQAFVKSDDQDKAVSAVKLIGQAGGKKTLPILLPVLSDARTPTTVRTVAVSALGRRIDGQDTGNIIDK